MLKPTLVDDFEIPENVCGIKYYKGEVRKAIECFSFLLFCAKAKENSFVKLIGTVRVPNTESDTFLKGAHP